MPNFLDSTARDFRYAFRSLAARPAFSVVAIVTIALGVGANTAIFGLVNGALLAPLPGMGDAAGLVEVSRNVGGEFQDVSYPIYLHLAENTAGLQSLAAYDLEPVSVAGSGEPRTTLSLSVSANYFDVVSVIPGEGRFFAPEEATPPASAPVAVVSEHLWRTQLGESPDIVGSLVRINGTPMTVIGVGPEGFRGHTRVPVDVFLPLGGGVQGLRSLAFLQDMESSFAELIGRVAPGASLEAVAASATAAGDQLLQAEAGAEAGSFRARVVRWTPIPASGRGVITAFLGVLMVVVGTVLLVACANVGGMLTSRAMERQGEIAVRRALGADRWRIVRQLLTESLLLFSAGGVAGVLLSVALTRLLLAFEPPLPPGFEISIDPSVDWRVLAFAMAITLATAVGFNLLPALRASRTDVAHDLAGAGRGRTQGRSRARGALIAAQMAGSTALLVIAGLFARSLVAVETVDTGWETEDRFAVNLDVAAIGSERAVGEGQYLAILERLEAHPAVASAALAAKAPLAGRSSFGEVNAAGAEPGPGRTGFEAAVNRVTTGYFTTLGVELLAGRAFDAADVEGGEPVAIVSERMAEVLWPGRSAVGERFFIGPVGSDQGLTVIGVVENTAVSDLAGVPEPFYYLPFSQWYNPQMTLLVRSNPGMGVGVPRAVRDLVHDVAPALPVETVLPLREGLAVFFLPQRLAAWVTGAVGLLGLMLAAVGVYGLTAFSVGRRTREIGVRLALGAAPGDVLRRVLQEGMRAPLIGMGIGVAVSAALATVAARFLTSISPGDPIAYGAAMAILLLTALGAALVPARRAARTDPAGSMRVE
ncbi:MAG: ABC transporter permease [Gemmatimonadota bacterium]